MVLATLMSLMTLGIAPLASAETKSELPKEFTESQRDTTVCKDVKDHKKRNTTVSQIASITSGLYEAQGDQGVNWTTINWVVEDVCVKDNSMMKAAKGDVKEFYDDLRKFAKIAIRTLEWNREAEAVVLEVKKDIKDGKGSSGIPIPASTYHNNDIKEVIKNGGVGAVYDVEWNKEKGAVSWKGRPLGESVLEPLNNRVLESGNLVVYPGYKDRLELIINPPKNLTANDFESFSLDLDSALTDYAAESFMVFSGGEIGQGDAAARATVTRPDGIPANQWNGQIADSYRESGYRVNFLQGGFPQLGAEKNADVYSIVSGGAPKFFMGRKEAGQWMDQHGIGPIRESALQGDWNAKMFGFKDKWTGYGMSVSNTINENAFKKGIVVRTDSVDNDDFGPLVQRVGQSVAMSFGIGLATKPTVKLGVRSATTWAGPKSMAIADNAFTGAIFLDNESKTAMNKLYGPDGTMHELATKEADKALPDGTERQKRAYKNNFIRGARNATLTEHKARGITGMNNLRVAESMERLKMVIKYNMPVKFMERSALAQSAGYRAGKSLAQESAVKAGGKVLTKVAATGLRATAFLVGSAGGPIGWAVAAILMAVDLALNWNDYKAAASAVTKKALYAMGSDKYPEPEPNDVKSANISSVYYGGYGLIDFGDNGRKFAETSLDNKVWTSEVVTPRVQKAIAAAGGSK